MKENIVMSPELRAMSNGRTSSMIKCMLLMACASILFAWSIFVKPVIALHGWDLTTVAYAGSLNAAGYALGICVGGNIYSKWGPKLTLLIGTLLLSSGVFLSAFVPDSAPLLIYLTYGAIAGTGVGTIYNAAMFAAGHWYPDNKGFAMGVSLAAFGGGGAFLAPICAKIIAVYGVQMTFIILGIAFLIIGLACSLTFKAAPDAYLDYASELRERQLANNTQRNYTLKEALRTRQFYCHAIGMAFRPAMWMVMSSFLVVYGTANGMSPVMATLAVSCAAIAQIATRLGLGFLADKWHWRKVYMHHFIFWIISFLLIVVFRSSGPVVIFIGYMFMASAYCGSSITNPIIDTITFGPRTAPSIFGTALLLWVAANIIVPRVGLNILSASGGNYMPMIIFGFVLSIIGDLSSFSITPINPNKFPNLAESVENKASAQ